MTARLEYHALTPERWNDFLELFGPRGAYGGCWCMWWRKTRKSFEQDQGDGNRQEMKELVDSGVVPGILAYSDREPVGWCSVAPREEFGSLERSPVLRRLDDQPVWSIVCLFVHKTQRNKGTSEALIRAAVEYASSRGAEVIEAYPTIPKSEALPPVSSYMGIPKIFERAGFERCGQPSESRLIMRYYASDPEGR